MTAEALALGFWPSQSIYPFYPSHRTALLLPTAQVHLGIDKPPLPLCSVCPVILVHTSRAQLLIYYSDAFPSD